MKYYSVILTFDPRIMLFGKVGGYRVTAGPYRASRNQVTTDGRYLHIPVTEVDFNRLRRGTICNPTKLVMRYLGEQRHGRRSDG